MEQVMETSNMEWVKQKGKRLCIIRCRDCEHIGSIRGEAAHCWSEVRWLCYRTQAEVTPDGYCAWAVRRP